jgi:tRNA A37 N6-isopentenylltransferase MiaA
VYEELKKIDPLYAPYVHWNNLKYVIRGIEVKLLTGKSKLEAKEDKKLRYETLFLTPYHDDSRKTLYDSIDLRVKKMFENGLIEEVSKLIQIY